jgi:hypothetical protein
MSTEVKPFKLAEEENATVKELANKYNAIALCMVAPFAPLRIAPRRSLSASFSYPDEFVLEEFINTVREKFPQKENRPALYLLLHSPGGTVSSSYMVARTLRNNFNKIVGFIPHIAASGATIVALSCNEIVMGDISRLSGIDPHYDTDGETIFPLSIVRAFKNLEAILGTKTLDEISYPYQHLVQSITAEKYDEAVHALTMVEGYTTELLQKAGYNDKEIEKIINGVLYDIEAHEEVITFERAKELGIKIKHFSEDNSYSECWKVMKEWLTKYFLKPSPIHFIKYCVPSKTTDSSCTQFKKDENVNIDR